MRRVMLFVSLVVLATLLIPSAIPASAAVPGSITIKTSATRTGKDFILSGVFTPGKAGDLVVCWVKKPGKRYWSYSSNRLCYDANGVVNWWYRYNPRVRGQYYYKASFPGNADVGPCVSRVVGVYVTAIPPLYVSRSAPTPPAPFTVIGTPSEIPTFYYTATGTKYHRDGCSYLSTRLGPITRFAATGMGLTPCSVCNP